MGLFNSTCCPPKPRRTIDYILNWIDKYGPIITKDTSYINDLLDWRRTVENDLDGYVKNAADEYITNYDWSQVPEFSAKADKVENVVVGHLASLDANGNLVDSGSGIDEAIEQGNMDLATCNAVYEALQGKADSVHTHNGIEDVVENEQYAKLYADNSNQGEPSVIIELNDSNTPGSPVTKSANINIDSIDNLNRALTTPSSIPEDDATKLITSKAVYDALAGKMSTTPVPIAITRSGSSYPLQDEQGTEQDLNDFIAGYPENKHFICNIEIDNGSGKGYATGVVYWEFKSSEDEIYVYVRIGVKEFVATGQSQGGESVSTWAFSWVLNDYSQNFF